MLLQKMINERPSGFKLTQSMTFFLSAGVLDTQSEFFPAWCFCPDSPAFYKFSRALYNVCSARLAELHRRFLDPFKRVFSEAVTSPLVDLEVEEITWAIEPLISFLQL